MQEYFTLSGHSLRKGRISAIGSVAVTFLALFIQVGYISTHIKEAPQLKDYNDDMWNPDYLAHLWTFRNKILDSQIAYIFFGCLALGLAMHAIYSAKKLYQNDESWFRTTLVACFGVAFLFAVLSGLTFLGVAVGSRSLSLTENVPQNVLQSLHVAYNLAVSVSSLLVAFQSILMSGGLFSSFVLSYRSGGNPKNRLTIRHGVFGLVIAIVGAFAFLFELITLLHFGMKLTTDMGVLSVIFSLFFTYILFPIWMIWLGVQLGTREIPDEEKSLLNNQL
jgi:hypothetical protein